LSVIEIDYNFKTEWLTVKKEK